jgi:hypothetical protein
VEIKLQEEEEVVGNLEMEEEAVEMGMHGNQEEDRTGVER